MRWDITPEFAARVRSLTQTRAANADPRLTAVITRHVVPLIDYAMWQRVTIPGIAPTRTSVAVRRPDATTGPDHMYVGAVADGSARVYSAPFRGTVPPSAFAVAETIPGAVDIALAFAGRYIKRQDKVEFITTRSPWVFWIDAAGDLYGRRVGDIGGELLASSVVAVSAIMGVAAVVGSMSEGLVVAYATTAGAAYTRQYFDGVWEAATVISAAPAGVVDLSLSRTWDWRVALQLQDSTGAVWQLLGRSLIMGASNTEQVRVSGVTVDISIGQIRTVTGRDAENIRVAGVVAGAHTGYTDAPLALSAVNIDNGSGNMGQVVRVVFDTAMGDPGSAAAWQLVDDSENVFAAGSIVKESGSDNVLLITFADFNNADNPLTLQYSAASGTMADYGGYAPVSDISIEFTASGLVPTAPPAPVTYAIVDNTTIDVEFDQAIAAADWSLVAADLSISGHEPQYVPGGELRPTSYIIDTATKKTGTTNVLQISLTAAGRMRYPQGLIGIEYGGTGGLTNGGGTASVAAFSGSASPGIRIVPFFNANDLETVEIADVSAAIGVGQIVPRHGNDAEAVEVAGVDASISVGFVEDIPT